MTTVLELNEGDKLVEQERINWDSTTCEPLILMVGVGPSAAVAATTVLMS